jgi:hypothetical protein
MYLEISGRQTGKTSRLIDHASDELLNNIDDHGHSICIVSPTNHGTVRISKMVKSVFIQKLGPVGEELRTIYVNRLHNKIKMSTTMTPVRGSSLVGNVTKYYIDEFAFIPNQDLIIGDNYYCTTPNGRYTFTTDLLNHCRRNGVEIKSYDISRGLRNSPYFDTEVNEFDNWCVRHGLIGIMTRHPFDEDFFIRKYIKKHKF